MVEVDELVDSVTATLTLSNLSTMKTKINNACVDDNEKFLFTPGETVILQNGSYTKNFSHELNCGSYSGSVTLSIQNGKLRCDTVEANNFKKSFLSGEIDGNLVFDIVQNKKTLTIVQPTSGQIAVSRNSIQLANGAVIGVGDKLVIEVSVDGSVEFKKLLVNGAEVQTTLSNGKERAEIIVTADTSISAETGVWHNICPTGGITVYSGGTYQLANYDSEADTRVTMTGYISDVYITSDCGDWNENIACSSEWTNQPVPPNEWTVTYNGYTETGGMALPYTATVTCSLSNDGFLSVSATATGENDFGSCTSAGGRFVITSIQQM